jgi:hypothetical protein
MEYGNLRYSFTTKPKSGWEKKFSFDFRSEWLIRVEELKYQKGLATIPYLPSIRHLFLPPIPGP